MTTVQLIAAGIGAGAFVLMTAAILTLRWKNDLDSRFAATICLFFAACATVVALDLLTGPFPVEQFNASVYIVALLEGLMLFLIWPVIRAGR